MQLWTDFSSRSSPPLARLPLPGGSAGATVAVTGLRTATMAGPRAYFFREPGLAATPRALGLLNGRASTVAFPVGAFLVEHPTAGALLVDTGLAAEASRSPARAVGRIGVALFGRPQIHVPVAAELSARGVMPQAVVMTHLHWDHASGLADLPGARVLVTKAEWRACGRRSGPLRGYLRRHLDTGARLELLDFAGAPPWGRFSRSIDLLGDGSVVLLATPGHSPGHLSVALRLADRTLLVAGDALCTMRNLREPERPWGLDDVGEYQRSLASIRAFARDDPAATIVPGHDLDAWEASGVEEGL